MRQTLDNICVTEYINCANSSHTVKGFKKMLKLF